MRKYKFRGKRIDNGDWEYGYYVSAVSDPSIDHKELSFIVTGPISWAFRNVIQVYPETVGQWTGKTDKEGKEIYEGDIIRILGWRNGEVGVAVYRESIASFAIEIRLNKAYYGSEVFSDPGYDDFCDGWTYDDGRCKEEIKKTFEVVGNIHEHPDLLQKEIQRLEDFRKADMLRLRGKNY